MRVSSYKHAKCKENVEIPVMTNWLGFAGRILLICSMTTQSILVLLVAGFLGGIANSMAGGASLITFPAMMAAGLAPIPANASNTVALILGNVMGAWTERRQIPVLDRSLWLAFGVAVLGGALGAVLLLKTPETFFVLVVPALIGCATVIFAFSKTIQSWVAKQDAGQAESLRAALLLPASIYGGYFGAGMGVIFMAVLSATSAWALRSSNAVKNILGALANGAAIVIFVVQGMVSWPQTLVMMGACLVGGVVGGKALGIVSATAMKIAIIAIGIVMTVFYAWRYWF
jgi:uncharacterized protein